MREIASFNITAFLANACQSSSFSSLCGKLLPSIQARYCTVEFSSNLSVPYAGNCFLQSIGVPPGVLQFLPFSSLCGKLLPSIGCAGNEYPDTLLFQFPMREIASFNSGTQLACLRPVCLSVPYAGNCFLQYVLNCETCNGAGSFSSLCGKLLPSIH